jgi:hypothetical protein
MTSLRKTEKKTKTINYDILPGGLPFIHVALVILAIYLGYQHKGLSTRWASLS